MPVRRAGSWYADSGPELSRQLDYRLNQADEMSVSSTTNSEPDDVSGVQSSENDGYNISYKKYKQLKEDIDDMPVLSYYGSDNEDYYEKSDENRPMPKLEKEISGTEDSVVDNDSNKENLTPECEFTTGKDANSEPTSQSDTNNETSSNILDANCKNFMVTSDNCVTEKCVVGQTKSAGSSGSTRAAGGRVNISENSGPSTSNGDNWQSGDATTRTKSTSSQIKKKGYVQLTISGMFDKMRSKD